MRISVIIPCFNRVELLPRAIDSVLSQKGAVLLRCESIADESESDAYELEVIVVDDGSTDGTKEFVAQHYPDVKYVYQKNQGVSAARNVAIKQATGDWIALLDSDDQWLPNKLQEQLSALRDTGLSICHTQEIWIRNGVRVNQMDKHKKTGGAIFTQCLPLCAMSPSSILIKASVFDRVGVFDEQLPACEDYDLWLRIAALYEIAYIETPLIYKYGGHEDQLSRQYWGMDRFRVIALQRVLDDCVYADALTANEYNRALKMLLKKLRILHKGAVKHSNVELVEHCQLMLDRWSTQAERVGS